MGAVQRSKVSIDQFMELAKKTKDVSSFKKLLNILYTDSWRGKKNPMADELREIFKDYYFHGTNAVDSIKNTGFRKDKYFNSGVYFSETPDTAFGYMSDRRGSGNTEDVFAIKLNDFKIKDIPYEQFRPINKGGSNEAERLVEKLKRQKYDGVRYSEDGTGETLVWNVDKINKQKPRTLTDIWNISKQKGLIGIKELLIGATAGLVGVGLNKILQPKEKKYKKPEGFDNEVWSRLEKLGYTEPDKEELETAKKEIEKNNKIRNGFIQSENRGSRDRGEDLYKSVNEKTGDVGKYQTWPPTIKAWSEPWLGKKYTVEEYKNDPEAQEKFMDEFLDMADRYGLTPEESAIIWHKGWGTLGFGSKSSEQKKKDLREHIEKQKQDPDVQEYVNQFLIGFNK